MKELMEKYKKSIPDKLSKIHELINEVKRSPTQEALAALRLAIHKLAGSAGTYGYEQASILCQELEKKLVRNENNLELDHFFLNLKKSLS